MTVSMVQELSCVVASGWFPRHTEPGEHKEIHLAPPKGMVSSHLLFLPLHPPAHVHPTRPSPTLIGEWVSRLRLGAITSPLMLEFKLS